MEGYGLLLGSLGSKSTLVCRGKSHLLQDYLQMCSQEDCLQTRTIPASNTSTAMTTQWPRRRALFYLYSSQQALQLLGLLFTLHKMKSLV